MRTNCIYCNGVCVKSGRQIKTGIQRYFCVGRRTKENISKVIKELLSFNPKYIYTDRLNIYEALIPVSIHRFYPKCTNHIERKNLTLRMLLKRLQRKSICFTRNEKMLYNTVYLWTCKDPFIKILTNDKMP